MYEHGADIGVRRRVTLREPGGDKIPESGVAEPRLPVKRLLTEGHVEELSFPVLIMPGECVVDTVSVLVDFLGTDYVKMCPGGEGRRYVRVSGHIRGYVSGLVDAEVKGTIKGTLQAVVEAGNVESAAPKQLAAGVVWEKEAAAGEMQPKAEAQEPKTDR